MVIHLVLCTFVLQTAEELPTVWLIPDAQRYHTLIDPAVYVMSCFTCAELSAVVLYAVV